MGLTFHEYKFLEEVSKKKEFKNILCLGKQEMILTKEDKKKLKVFQKTILQEEYENIEEFVRQEYLPYFP
mgnify:CR=1 FL=1